MLVTRVAPRASPAPDIWSGPLTTYTLYVHDARYAVPTLFTVDMRDDERAKAYAARHLESSPHYRSVEIWEDERLVGSVAGATGPAEA